MRVIANLDELKSLVGQEVAVSEWIRIDQQRIDAFAAVTGDQQWIHVDPERAGRESPYRSTIAHGFLTLSLLPQLRNAALRIDGARMIINYGLDRVRFPAPVRVGANIRARFRIAGFTAINGGVQVEWHAEIECEGGTKPVCAVVMLMRCYL